MPTIISHAAVPIALGIGVGCRSRALFLCGIGMAMLPDLDVLLFRWGLVYGSGLGHRGISHSLLFAALASFTLAAALASRRVCGMWAGFAFLFIAIASHPVLDAFTDGGKGVALLWPWSEYRFFFPWRPIRVSPIGVERLMGARGWQVLLSELRYVWLPCASVALCLWLGRHARQPAQAVTGQEVPGQV
ncbi:metal-dependent hydrolase [Uliginosibacterium gangwonense]|uniref:metal-dependent hydrolase n=1 Tax=Uliginosibacterium gangwonense TaxID=392736 RepID=UPI000687253F|nr:metal-dependent hydrolase [Uliginosibacterium gangwonense]